jgi:DNA repair protein RadA/Sms
LLVEIQALVAPTSLGTPRRAAVGVDQSRLSMILAVLEARCGVRLSGHDVYVNVAGGLRILEPAADLAVAAALVSSLSNAALPADAVYFGEVSLTGAVRAVPQAAARLKEAGKLGFARAVIPETSEAKASSSLFRGAPSGADPESRDRTLDSGSAAARRPGMTESEGLQINAVSALTALVAEIAARSPRAPRRAVGGAEDG